MTPRRILVIGDVMLDVVVKPMTAVAPTSDTPARIRLSRGGSAANMAVALLQLANQHSDSINYEVTGSANLDLPFMHDLPFHQSGAFALKTPH